MREEKKASLTLALLWRVRKHVRGVGNRLLRKHYLTRDSLPGHTQKRGTPYPPALPVLCPRPAHTAHVPAGHTAGAREPPEAGLTPRHARSVLWGRGAGGPATHDLLLIQIPFPKESARTDCPSQLVTKLVMRGSASGGCGGSYATWFPARAFWQGHSDFQIPFCSSVLGP